MSEQKPTAEAIKELIQWSNSQSLLLSLLYDLDLMPEQIAKSDTVRFGKMIAVMLHFKQFDVERSLVISAKDLEMIAKDEQLVTKDVEILSLNRKIERANRETCKYLAELEAVRTELHTKTELLREAVSLVQFITSEGIDFEALKAFLSRPDVVELLNGDEKA